jgi:hypothetical protein
MVRVGALLLLLSPFLPHGRVAGEPYGPLLVLRELDPLGSDVAQLGVAAWLFLPAAAGAMVLAGVWRPAPPHPLVRALTLAVLIAASFALATLGSVLLTQTGTAGPGSGSVPFALSLLLFAAPLVLGGVALARLVGGDFDRSSGGYARLSLGLLLALNGFFLCCGGWELLLSLLKQNGIPRALAGAWPAPAGGLLIAAGEALTRLRPRAGVDSVPASG